jgi:hypothetical protein
MKLLQSSTPSSELQVEHSQKLHFGRADDRLNPDFRSYERLEFTAQVFRTLAIFLLFVSWYLLVIKFPLLVVRDLAALVYAPFIFPWIVDRLAAKKLSAVLHTRADLPSPGIQLPAKVRVIYFGVPCTRDVGIVTFMDGYLQFDGSLTNFGIRPQDFQFEYGSSPSRSVWTNIASSIPIRLKFEPIDQWPGKKKGLVDVFNVTWSKWRQTQEETISHSIYPPIRRSLGRLDVARRLRKSVHAGVLVAGLTFFLGGRSAETSLWVLAAIPPIYFGIQTLYEAMLTRYIANRVMARWFLIGDTPLEETLIGGETK